MRLRKDTNELLEEEILLIAQVSDALAHPARIKIFRYIMAQNKILQKVCNKDLVAHFDYSQATISQHVKKLRDAGLLHVKKEDRFSFSFGRQTQASLPYCTVSIERVPRIISGCSAKY